MAEKKTVSFKVFLQREGPNEVRRLDVNGDMAWSFVHLKGKLQSLFPSLREQDFIVAWKDSDDDDIVISSDEELKIALGELQSDINKLYVKTSAADKRQTAGGYCKVAECNVCKKEVSGTRSQCPYCVLCNACESKGLHPGHRMICKPFIKSWKLPIEKVLVPVLARAVQGGVYSGGSEPEGGQRSRTHRGEVPRWVKHIDSCVRELEKLRLEEESQSKQGTTEKDQQNGSHSEFLQNVGQTVAEALDPLGIDVDIQTRVQNQKIKKADDEKNVSNQKEETDTKKNNITEAQNFEMDDGQEEESVASSVAAEYGSQEAGEWIDQNQDFSQQQGEHLYRHPYAGIPREGNAANVVYPVAVFPPPLIPNPHRLPVPGIDVLKPQPVFPPTAPAFPPCVLPASVPFNVYRPVHSQMYVPHPRYPGETHQRFFYGGVGDAETGTARRHPAAAFPSAVGAMPTNVPVPGGPMPYNNILPSQCGFQTAPSHIAMPAAVPHCHAKPHIAAAFENMTAMGFTNDSDWLIHLLESCNGDIQKALDVLDHNNRL